MRPGARVLLRRVGLGCRPVNGPRRCGRLVAAATSPLLRALGRIRTCAVHDLSVVSLPLEYERLRSFRPWTGTGMPGPVCFMDR